MQQQAMRTHPVAEQAQSRSNDSQPTEGKREFLNNGISKRGRLLNGNPAGDPTTSPRCGARSKRTGQPCKAPGVRRPDGSYSRCKFHGGRSTGPRTEAGRARCAQNALRHGRYTAAAKAARAEQHTKRRALRTKLKALEQQILALEAKGTKWPI